MCDGPRMAVRGIHSHPVLREAPPGFRPRDVGVRPATPEERPLRGALMDLHHCPGFRRLAARGLRHVAVWRGRRVAPGAWRGGASGAVRATGGPAGGRSGGSGGWT